MTDHHYESLYDKYLEPIAGKELRLLEGEKPSSLKGLRCSPVAEETRSKSQLSPLYCSGPWLRHGIWTGPLLEGGVIYAAILCKSTNTYAVKSNLP